MAEKPRLRNGTNWYWRSTAHTRDWCHKLDENFNEWKKNKKWVEEIKKKNNSFSTIFDRLIADVFYDFSIYASIVKQITVDTFRAHHRPKYKNEIHMFNHICSGTDYDWNGIILMMCIPCQMQIMWDAIFRINYYVHLNIGVSMAHDDDAMIGWRKGDGYTGVYFMYCAKSVIALHGMVTYNSE